MHTSCDACLPSLLFLRRDMRLCVFWRTGRKQHEYVCYKEPALQLCPRRPSRRPGSGTGSRAREGWAVCVWGGEGGVSCCLGFLLGAAVSKCDPPPLHITPSGLFPLPSAHTLRHFSTLAGLGTLSLRSMWSPPHTKKHLETGLVGLKRIHICPVQAIGIQSFTLSDATKSE